MLWGDQGLWVWADASAPALKWYVIALTVLAAVGLVWWGTTHVGNTRSAGSGRTWVRPLSNLCLAVLWLGLLLALPYLLYPSDDPAGGIPQLWKWLCNIGVALVGAAVLGLIVTWIDQSNNDERVRAETRRNALIQLNSGTDLTGIDLRRADLSNAYLKGKTLTDANLRWVNLCQANLSFARLEQAEMEGAKLAFVSLDFAHLERAHLVGADLTGADLTGAHLNGADLTGADLTGADLTGTNLQGANLIGANLTGTNISLALM